ncbi:Peptidase M23 [Gemmatirosa kalamazoonensis]|uniref:Peptidase M23 n=2 Tax=Gemmatirosa kalamazoonensis TaxID=861299 RepID=W0RPA3_9BACT|nr:Peptidase M23 [Gemmatirosa kalamazoonensis]
MAVRTAPSAERRARRTRIALCALRSAFCAVAIPAALSAQTPAPSTQAQRAELEKVRRERAALQQRMRVLQGTVHDLSEEVANLDRQADATARLVSGLDAQLASLDRDVQGATARLYVAQKELDGKTVSLQHRLVDIYKRGPLYTAEVLFSAASLGELVTRYKYLHELALRDRSLVRRVQQLRDDVLAQQSLLVRLRGELARNREEKSSEEQRLRSLQTERAASLAQARQQQDRTRARLAQIARDEARLTSVIASLEDARKRAEARPRAPAPAPSTLKPRASTASPAGTGTLAWPVNGSLLYRFGRVVNPNNTTTRWNGIGISAATGTVVRAVAAGTVVLAEPMGTYGLTVIVQHGGGDYSVYGSLARADVRKGATVAAGQALGTVGSADPDLPPHLHFEVRPGGRAVDPLTWLGKR